jgi:hypothetical protein
MAIKSNLEEPKNLGHLMLDLETMGKRAGCAIVSIGAVEFNIKTGEFGREFYERVELQSCLNVGLFVEASTVYWWMMQSDEARQEFCKTPRGNIQNVLGRFNAFLGCLDDYQIWGNGARFDIAILEAAYFACNMGEKLPWKFRNERDVRTLVSFAPAIKGYYPFTGTEHNPIDDCYYQISYCSAIWNKLNTK